MCAFAYRVRVFPCVVFFFGGFYGPLKVFFRRKKFDFYAADYIKRVSLYDGDNDIASDAFTRIA